jgi:hypothetical protein
VGGAGTAFFISSPVSIDYPPNVASPRRKILIVGTIATLAFGIGLVFAFRTRSDIYPNHPQVLPDGSVLTLLRVDYGKTNELIDGTWFQKTFRRFIPKTGANILGYKIQPPTIIGTTVSLGNELVFWIRHTGPTGKTNAAPISPRWPFEWLNTTGIIAFDENGNEYRSRPGFVRGSNATNHLIIVEVPAFPRDGKVAGIRIFRRSGMDSAEWRQTSEFKTGNPDPGPHSHWKAHPFPDTQKSGDVEFSLTGLKLVPPRWRVERSFSHPGEYWSIPSFRITVGGNTTRDWEPKAASLFEANGNWHGPDLFTWFPGLSEPTILGTLNPAEPWKLHVEFCRTSGFVAEELWTIPSLSLASVSPGDILAATNMQGTPVNIRLARSGFLQVNLPAHPTDLCPAIVRVLDDTFQNIVTGHSSSTSQHSQTVQIAPTRNSTNLTVTVAVTKSVWIDFLAQPTIDVTGSDSPPSARR